jgi:DNA-binding XRE family transcriptional regulator
MAKEMLRLGLPRSEIARTLDFSRQRISQLAATMAAEDIPASALKRDRSAMPAYVEITDEIRKNVPRILYNWRVRNHLTQTQAAHIFDVALRTYTGWEFGTHVPVMLGALINFIHFWNMELDRISKQP